MLRAPYLGYARNRIPVIEGWRKWSSSDCPNGRPYWDLANSAGGTAIPTASLSTGADNYGWMFRFGILVPWSVIAITFSDDPPNTSNIQIVASDVSTGGYYAGTLGSISAHVLTITRATQFATTGGTVGSGVSGDLPSAIKYLGFGHAASGGNDTYLITGITLTP